MCAALKILCAQKARDVIICLFRSVRRYCIVLIIVSMRKCKCVLLVSANKLLVYNDECKRFLSGSAVGLSLALCERRLACQWARANPPPRNIIRTLQPITKNLSQVITSTSGGDFF